MPSTVTEKRSDRGDPLADDETREANADYQDARREFEQARRDAVKKHGGDLNALASDGETTRRLKELSDRAEELRDRRRRTTTGRASSSTSRDGTRSLGAEFIRRMEAQGGKALDATSGGTFVPSVWDPALVDLPAGQTFVRTLIPHRSVSGDKVQYLEQTVRTNNAAPVERLAVKPTSVLTVVRREVEIATVATVTEAFDRLLFADYEALRDFIDQQLRLMVLEAIEGQIVTGDGTPPNMRGILATPGIGSAGPPGVGETAADALYAGITALRQEFLEADGIAINPSDWQGIRLLKTTTDEYLAGSVIADDPPTIWGKRVVTTSVIPAGTALVGAWGQGAVVFDREQTRLSFSETGAGDVEGTDLFSTNALRWRAESRLGFAVTRPSAFVEVDLAA